MFIISQSFLCLTFLLRKLIDAVLVTFAGTFVDTLSTAFIISSHVITESLVALAKYSPFSQLYVARFQIQPFYMNYVPLDFCTHTDIYLYFTFDSSYIFYCQTSIYIHMMYVLLIFSTDLFLLSY